MMASRNRAQGLYVGSWVGKQVRRKKLIPPIMAGNEVIFPEAKPFVNSHIAWLTLRDRKSSKAELPIRRRRYTSKASRSYED